ncbi:MAG TPA: hypothetical protein VN778_01400 [Verrucomicrobiae bacterium]|nr:hypothetical protein [Verrucomicrobiae bacterium]
MRGIAIGLEWVYGKVTGKGKEWAADKQRYKEALAREFERNVEAKLALTPRDAQRIGEAALRSARESSRYGDFYLLSTLRAAAYFAFARLTEIQREQSSDAIIEARRIGARAIVGAERKGWEDFAISGYASAAAQLTHAGLPELPAQKDTIAPLESE